MRQVGLERDFSQGFASKCGCEALRLNLSETIQVCS